MEIYIKDGELEICGPEKGPVRIIYASYVMHYILQGQGTWNGQVLRAGQGFVCLKDMPVHYYPDEETPWTYLWFRVDGTQVRDYLHAYGLDVAPYSFAFDWTDDLHRLMACCFENGRFTSRNELFAEGCARLLFSFHPRPMQAQASVSQRTLHVRAAKAYIEEHYQERVTVLDVAGALHLSRGYLRNIFFEHTHMSPQQYLIQTRLARAKELLSQGDIPISLLAPSVGYADVAQFYRIFKKYVGQSPQTYRRHGKG